MSSIFGSIAYNAVTLDTSQTVSGKKRFLNVGNEMEGTLLQPTILALSQSIDPTELSFLAGASSNIQTQIAGINIVLTGLTALEQALQAIEPAPNATTVQFNNSILLQDPAVLTTSLTLDPSSITALEALTITSATDTINLDAGLNINLNTPSGNIGLTSGIDIVTLATNTINLDAGLNINLNAFYGNIGLTSGGAIGITAGADMTLSSPNLYNINLDAENLNAYGYALPICFTRERHDNFSYNVGGQQMEQVYNLQMAVPYQFFADTPQANYTSSVWKIDFALNCYDCSLTGDKGRALYIEFTDQNGTVYTPNTYNLEFPYAIWGNSSSYNGVSHSNFQNFNWSDFVDFNAMTSTGSGNLPLNCYLYFAGDDPLNAKFIMTVTLTRTNQI